jgi:hypothetical protein
MPRQADAGVRPEDGPQDVPQEPDSIVESEVPGGADEVTEEDAEDGEDPDEGE